MGQLSWERATIRTKPLLLWVAHICIGALGITVVAFETLRSPARGPLVLFAIVAAITAWRFVIVPKIWHVKRGHLIADDRGLRLDGTKIVSPAHVREAHIVEDSSGVRVHLERALGPVEVYALDETEGAAILRALRLDACARAARFEFVSGNQRRALLRLTTQAVLGVAYFSALVMTFDSMTTTHVLIILPIFTLLGFAHWVILGPSTASIHVGSDGLLIRHGTLPAQFVPYADVENIAIGEGSIELLLRSGAKTTLSYGEKGLLRYLLNAGGEVEHSAERARDFTARIRHHLAKSEDVASMTTMLARGTQTTNEWVNELVSIHHEHSQYRKTSFPPDALWRLVENRDASATTRVGAAVVLARTNDADCPERLRRIAEATTSPRVRVALRSLAAATNDESIGDAIDDIVDVEECSLRAHSVRPHKG